MKKSEMNLFPVGMNPVTVQGLAILSGICFGIWPALLRLFYTGNMFYISIIFSITSLLVNLPLVIYYGVPVPSCGNICSALSITILGTVGSLVYMNLQAPGVCNLTKIIPVMLISEISFSAIGNSLVDWYKNGKTDLCRMNVIGILLAVIAILLITYKPGRTV